MTTTKVAKKAPAGKPVGSYIDPPVAMTLPANYGTKKADAKATAEAPTPAAEPKGKVAALTALLLRREGATLAAMQDATGWQAHSVRGAISGSLKKKLGLEVTSEKVEGVRTYRIARGGAA